MKHKPPKIGLALGSGSARGWSHIGVIRALEEAGISPDIVCGTSIGSLVGAAYAGGQIERLETWVRSLTWQGVLSLLDFTVNGGLIHGEKLFTFIRTNFSDTDITELPKAYGAVATDLLTGREVWLREGSTFDAVRASAALPGLFTPTQIDGQLLVDGALVNPVPVSLCRAMGADIVIAVDLNSDLIGKHNLQKNDAPTTARTSVWDKIPQSLKRLKKESTDSNDIPSIFDVVTLSLSIMQVRITRSRLAGEPADILIRPRLANFAFMDYSRAAEAIDEGERAIQLVMPEIKELFKS